MVVTVGAAHRGRGRAVPRLPRRAGADLQPDGRRSSRRPAATRSPGCSTTARWSRRIGAAIERLRGTGDGLEIAILDIDNFRILNDTWGHAAGDEAHPRRSTAQLEPLASAALAVGRYGPDEFLVAVDGRGGRGRWRRAPRPSATRSARSGLKFGDSNDLPLTDQRRRRPVPRGRRLGDGAAGQRGGHPARGPGRGRRRGPGRPAPSPRWSARRTRSTCSRA